MRDFASFRVELWVLRLTVRALVAMLFAAILAFLAPFSTYRFGLLDRVGYWTVLMAAWLVLSLAASWLVWQVPAMRSRSDGQRRITAIVIATLPMMLVTGVANNMMTGWQPYVDEVAELFFSILLIGGGSTYLADRLVAGLTDPPVARGPAVLPEVEVDRPPAVVSPAVEGPTDSTLIERLPPHIRGEILCLQVEDHYVRVHSRNSSAMVLMRFSDALRGIDHIPGAQVHRSWWVATDAVAALRKTGRTAQLTLSNGTSVPVSQPYLAQAVSSWGALER
jgi:hypothetical protein